MTVASGLPLHELFQNNRAQGQGYGERNDLRLATGDFQNPGWCRYHMAVAAREFMGVIEC